MPQILKRRKRPKSVEDWCTYHFRIERHLTHYSLGRPFRFDATAHSEHLQPQLEAICLSPEKLKDRLTTFSIIGDRNVERDLWMQKAAPPNEFGIGTLTMRGQQSTYLGALPFDVVWHILALIAAGSIRYVYLHGAGLHHGTARITSIGFDAEIDETGL